MKRLIDQQLIGWKHAPRRKPLVVRGARQIGKTWSIGKFGAHNFENTIKVDFEKRLDVHAVFDADLSPSNIVMQLELIFEASIEPGKTLLFFDEIQACPRALMCLRYFYEEMPELHVISAGSLLEFALEDIPFPVGRVQFLNMYPLSFHEYLLALNKSKLASKLTLPPEALPQIIHEKLLRELKNYFFIGGMPECINEFLETQSIQEVFSVQDELIESYRQDFSKYAPRSNQTCLNMILRNCAQQVGEQTMYSKLAEGFSGQVIHHGFDLLELAKILYRIPSTTPGLPLGADVQHKRFKTAILDIGLMHRLNDMSIQKELLDVDLIDSYRGKLAEQFVAQELRSAQNSTLYYWARQAKSSAAEIDFLIQIEDEAIPVEVKSGKGGSLRSMHLLLNTYSQCKYGVVLYTGKFVENTEQKLIFMPLYYAGQLSKSSILTVP